MRPGVTNGNADAMCPWPRSRRSIPWCSVGSFAVAASPKFVPPWGHGWKSTSGLPLFTIARSMRCKLSFPACSGMPTSRASSSVT